MNGTLRARAAAVFLGVAAAVACTAAMAVPYTFTQGGYTGGGVVSGTFEGVDLDSDGLLVSFVGEVTGFTLSFSGNAAVAPFSHALADLHGLVFTVGNTTLGSVATGILEEGIASNYGGTTGIEYATGVGPTGGFGGRITDIASGTSITTTQLVQVAVVPEPAGSALLLCGLGAVAWRVRRRSAFR